MPILEDIQIAVKNIENSNIENIDEAVIKHASHLPKEAIKRVIEIVNVNQFVNLMKSGKDRTSEFQVADPNIVLKDVSEKSFKETNFSKSSFDTSLDFYLKDERLKKEASDKYYHNIQKANDLSLIKTEKNIVNKYSKDFLRKKAYEVKKKEFVKEAFSKLQNITTELYKEFDLEKNKYSKKDIHNVFEDLHNSYIDKKSTCNIFITKQAKDLGIDNKYNKKFIINDKHDLYKIATQLIQCLDMHNDMKKMAEDDEEDDKKKGKKEKGIDSKNLFQLLGSIGKWPASLLNKSMEGRIKGVESENIKNKKKSQDKIISSFKSIKNIQKLLNHDDIIKTKNPNEVLDYYMTIMKIAPNLAANNPTLIVPVLRLATSNGMFGPYEAKTVVDLENALYGEPKK